MSDGESKWKWKLRWAIAAALVICVILMAKRSPFGFLLGLPLLIAVALLIMPELMKPIGLLVDSIFGTGTLFAERPPLDLRLAQHYVKEERFADAIDEYERVRGYYPDIPEVYEEPLVLLAKIGAEREEIDELYRTGQRKITEAEARGNLSLAYDRALEELRRNPGN